MPLGNRTNCKNAKYAGLWPASLSTCVANGIQEAFHVGFDFLALSLNHAKLGTGINNEHQALTPIRSDLDLNAQSWTSQVVGVASDFSRQISDDSGDSDRPNASASNAASCRFVSRVLGKELGWASYLGLQAVMLPSVERMTKDVAPMVAQAVSQALASKTYLQVWVQLPVALSLEDHSAYFGTWQLIRTLCNYHSQLRLCLLLGEDLPDSSQLDIWTGEPVRSAIIPISAFKFNSKGYPTLPKGHQDFISKLLHQGVQLILRDDFLDHKIGQDVIRSAQDQEGGPLKVYWEYLSYLFRRIEPLNEVEAAEFEYRDYLQSPLQPLQDHLESATYEVFERDKMKYSTYEEAVYKALVDRFPSEGREPVLMVVGAGRGPLVLASLRASKRAKRSMRVYAVEKNPNAYITLLDLHRREKWGDVVTIVHQDMRHWVTEEKADILVSELLGSFGDNELSPECLDGAQRFLAPGGISIPQSYTSFLAPITTSKVHEEVRNLKNLKDLETPYVVKLFAHTLLSENQEVFYFEHPNLEKTIDNSRFKTLTFRRPESAGPAVLHGFAGYFESVLYKDVLLSIRPETHTPNMFSWFPIFFPLVKPVYLKGSTSGGGGGAGGGGGEQDDITVHMWRRSARHKVWYEYALTSPEMQPLVNPEGRSYAAEL